MLDIDPNDAFVLYGIAQEHSKVGEFARAVEYFARCVESDPNYLYAYYHKASAEHEDGNDAGAGATLRVGIERAKQAGDTKALGEMQALLDSIE